MSKVQVKGIFVGAKVVRGPDWDWGNQVYKNDCFTAVRFTHNFFVVVVLKGWWRREDRQGC